jgi:hypothetical protein
MNSAYLDQSPTAGGERVEIPKRIKFGDLQNYRRQHGRRETTAVIGIRLPTKTFTAWSEAFRLIRSILPTLL